ncbi:hypothetical protein QL285_038667 [Trifolium repens]|nr:hypothetical protein QL285_038667 [Trifolium repens]
MGTMNDTGWRWNLTWRRNFFSWEIPLFHEMLAVIEGFQPLDCEDSWQWRADPTAGFTSKSAYHALINLQNNGNQLSHMQQFVFKNIRKSAAPSKVISFSWQLVLDRIPSKQNLMLCGVDTGIEALCVACNSKLETSVHLFLHCDVAAHVWYEIARWVGHDLIMPPTLGHSFSLLLSCGFGKIRKKGLALIWHAFIWSIWRARNNRIFNNGSSNSYLYCFGRACLLLWSFKVMMESGCDEFCCGFPLLNSASRHLILLLEAWFVV